MKPITKTHTFYEHKLITPVMVFDPVGGMKGSYILPKGAVVYSGQAFRKTKDRYLTYKGDVRPNEVEVEKITVTIVKTVTVELLK